ncbi:MAG: SLATT domain-containing protein [Roseibium sp.]
MEVMSSLSNKSNEIENEVIFLSKAHNINCKRWRKRSRYIGIPTAVFGIFAGGSVLTEFGGEDYNKFIVSASAFLGALFGVLDKQLNPSERAASHRSASLQFEKIKNDVFMFRDVRLKSSEFNDPDKNEVIVNQFDKILDSISQAKNNAPVLSETAKKLANTD